MASHPLAYFTRRLGVAIDEALHPKGMHTNGPCYVRIPVSHAKAIHNHLMDVVTQPEPERRVGRACCANEKRNMNGGCDNCGDPCL